MGVWVAASSGSGFADWRPVDNGANTDYWYFLPEAEKYSLHVGCGRTPADWGMSASTPVVSGHHNSFNCYDVRGAKSYGTCTKR